MSCSSDRGQTEPIAALLAVLVVSAGLALYADVLNDAVDVGPDRDVAAPALERVEAHLTPTGVAHPRHLRSVGEVVPSGYDTNVTLSTDDHQWSYGPAPAPDADAASRTVSVRTGPATIRRARLRVVIWT